MSFRVERKGSFSPEKGPERGTPEPHARLAKFALRGKGALSARQRVTFGEHWTLTQGLPSLQSPLSETLDPTSTGGAGSERRHPGL